MKTNDAPKKIYLYPSDRASEEYEAEWGDKPWGEGCVEYTRTDAFIEKTCEWIKRMWSETNDRFNEDFTGMLIDNFKNYLKGE